MSGFDWLDSEQITQEQQTEMLVALGGMVVAHQIEIQSLLTYIRESGLPFNPDRMQEIRRSETHHAAESFAAEGEPLISEIFARYAEDLDRNGEIS